MNTQLGPNKALAVGGAGALATIIVAVFSYFNMPIDAGFATALATIILTAVTWFTPHGGVTTPPPTAPSA